MQSMDALLAALRACTICQAHLPLGPRPVVQLGAGARVLVIGQAPGAKVHTSGVPWQDASGQRLRAWMGVHEASFYNPTQIALLPMGFCYPGKGASGDMPPRPECAPYWHQQVLALLPSVRLTLLVGQYAQAYYLGSAAAGNLTETVRQYADYLPRFFPLPHPSPRNGIWLRKHRWFEHTVVPQLQQRILDVLKKEG